MKTTNHLFQFTNFNLLLSGFVFLMSLSSSHVFADENEFFKSRFSDEWLRASDSELESLRGGFKLSNGLEIDFSFEKIIFKNGVETFSSYFEFPKNIPIIQNGALNSATAFSNAMLNSVIQNSLDNQVIRTVNTINIDIKGIEAFRNSILPTFK